MKKKVRKKLVQQVERHIEALYRESRKLLLDPHSYDTSPVDTRNVLLYCAFLESAVETPYHRLMALCEFLEHDNVLCYMYPFMMLYDDTRQCIVQKGKRAMRLTGGICAGAVDPCYLSFYMQG